MKNRYVSIKWKKTKIKIPKLKHTYIKKFPINGLLMELLAHKRISLPGRGKDKEKLFI